MRYTVTTGPDQHHEVDVTELPSGALQVSVDGQPVDVDVVDVAGALNVRIDGKVVDLTTEGTLPDLGVVTGRGRGYVRVLSERLRAAEAGRKDAGAGELLVRSPMPGRVVKVLVAPGDVLTVGQALLVIEAMKMENELRARRAGTVAEVHVTAGAAVEANAKLVTLA